MDDDFHDFFVASAGVAGALIGLLFVAISVSRERLDGEHGEVQRIRTAAALTSFLNTLVVSLFGLIPSSDLASTLVIIAAIGEAFVVGAALYLVRVGGWRNVRFFDVTFLVGMAAVFAFQLITGVEMAASKPGSDMSVFDTRVAVLVVVCFLIGIARAYEVIGGPAVGLKTEISRQVRSHRHPHGGDEPS